MKVISYKNPVGSLTFGVTVSYAWRMRDLLIRRRIKWILFSFGVYSFQFMFK